MRDENVTCRKVFVTSCKRLEKKSLLVIKYILYNSSIFAAEKKVCFFNRLGLLIVRFNSIGLLIVRFTNV